MLACLQYFEALRLFEAENGCAFDAESRQMEAYLDAALNMYENLVADK